MLLFTQPSNHSGEVPGQLLPTITFTQTFQWKQGLKINCVAQSVNGCELQYSLTLTIHLQYITTLG